MDHKVLDCSRIIAKLEIMNMEQVDPEKGQETETMTKPEKESEAVILQIKKPLNDHRHVILSEIFKEK